MEVVPIGNHIDERLRYETRLKSLGQIVLKYSRCIFTEMEEKKKGVDSKKIEEASNEKNNNNNAKGDKEIKMVLSSLKGTNEDRKKATNNFLLYTIIGIPLYLYSVSTFSSSFKELLKGESSWYIMVFWLFLSICGSLLLYGIVRYSRILDKMEQQLPPKSKKEKDQLDQKEDIAPFVLFRRITTVLAALILWVINSFLGGRIVLRIWDYYYDIDGAQGWSWKPFLIIQVITTRLTYYISRLFNIPVKLEKATGLTYPNPLNTIIIIPECTAILEMIFITALMMGFIMGWGMKMNIRKRVKWLAVMWGIIFVENQIRLVLNWPIAKAYGKAGWHEIHMAWWKQYQLIFVIVLFIGWFLLIGRKYLPAKEKENKKEAPNQHPKKEPVAPST